MFRRFATLVIFLVGTIVYQVLVKLFDKLMCGLFNMRILKPFDEFFLYDDPSSLSHVTVIMETDKFSGPEMSEYLYGRINGLMPQCRLKLYTIFGQSYFMHMST